MYRKNINSRLGWYVVENLVNYCSTRNETCIIKFNKNTIPSLLLILNYVKLSLCEKRERENFKNSFNNFAVFHWNSKRNETETKVFPTSIFIYFMSFFPHSQFTHPLFLYEEDHLCVILYSKYHSAVTMMIIL